MEGCLDQTHTRSSLSCYSSHDVCHQKAANRLILHTRIDCDRADTVDGVALIEDIAAHNPIAHLCHDTVETRMRQEPLEKASCDLR